MARYLVHYTAWHPEDTVPFGIKWVHATPVVADTQMDAVQAVSRLAKKDKIILEEIFNLEELPHDQKAF